MIEITKKKKLRNQIDNMEEFMKILVENWPMCKNQLFMLARVNSKTGKETYEFMKRWKLLE